MYAKVLGIPEPTFNDYLHGFSRWLFSEWGYAMRDCFHTGFEGSLRPGETMFTLQPAGSSLRFTRSAQLASPGRFQAFAPGGVQAI